jgi:hypothetical protein
MWCPLVDTVIVPWEFVFPGYKSLMIAGIKIAKSQHYILLNQAKNQLKGSTYRTAPPTIFYVNLMPYSIRNFLFR